MQQDIFNLQIFVDHTSAIQGSASLSQADRYLKKTKSQYAAVLNGSKVMGLTTPQVIHKHLRLDKQDKEIISYDCLIQNPIICCSGVSIEKNINYALSRPEDQLLEDIVLIDDSMDFLGLITANSLLRLQKRYFTQKSEQNQDLINSQNERINNLINDLKIANTKLEESRLMVAKIQAMRTAFISRFSHEARTPMMSVKGILELLETAKMPADQKQMIRTADTSTQTLLRLIQSTQDYAQIGTDNIQLDEQTFSPIKALRACLKATKAEAEEKGLIVELEHDEIPEHIIGDKRRFQQAIENLIGKAIDHTSAGGVTITASEQENQGKLLLHIEIKDTSSGWETTEADQLFDNSQTSNTNPTCDIGALVSERIIHKLGGTLSCSYSPGEGSLFIIELPVKVLSPLTRTLPDGTSTPISPPDTPAPKTTTTATPLNVLIIDDNSINLDIARRFLVKLNCNVHIALNGKEGIDKLRNTPIDCIFLDCRMPGLSGYDTAQLIRRGEAGAKKANVFISAMTAHISNKARKECFESGMNFFIPKPVSQRHFVDAIEASRKQHEEPVTLFDKSAATG